MPPKLTFKQVKDIFEKEGCKLVSDEYINNKQKLKFICKCHIDDEEPSVYEILFCNFQSGTRCKDCRNDRIKVTMIERYGVTHLTQIPEKKEKMLKGIVKYIEEKKHKLEDLKVIYEEIEKMKATKYLGYDFKLYVFDRKGTILHV